MKITRNNWQDYIDKLAAINKHAADLMSSYVENHGLDNIQDVIDYAFALTTKYGEAAAALACEMYDAEAMAEGAVLPSAVPAAVPAGDEVAKAVHATKNNMNMLTGAVGRLIKRTAADTTLKNAIRDGAQFAWIPHGDTCAFCITLASRGWQYVSKNTLKKATLSISMHIVIVSTLCDMITGALWRGYDPDKYLRMYKNADGTKPKDKINSMRRIIEAQQRKIEVDKSVLVRIKRTSEIETYKALSSKYDLYVSANSSIKQQGFDNIEKAIEKSIDKLNITDLEDFPRIYVLTQEEAGSNILAAYNAVKNELYISDVNGNKSRIIDIQKNYSLADAEHADSTIRHELIHWSDADSYRKENGKITADNYAEYLRNLRNRCKIELDKVGINSDNVSEISPYAELSYARNEFDEVYTEFRTKNSDRRK